MNHLRNLQREAAEAGGRWSAAVVAAEEALDEYRTAHNAVLAYKAEIARLEAERKQLLSKREREVIERLSGWR